MTFHEENLLDLIRYMPDEMMAGRWNRYQLRLAHAGEAMPAGYQSKYRTKAISIPPRHFGVYFSYKPVPSCCVRRYIGRIFPRFLTYDRLTRQVIGILKAEMGKSPGKKQCNRVVNFSNSSPALMEKVLSWFERLGLARQDWRWYIKFNLKLREKEETHQTKVREIASREFWKTITGLADKMTHPKWNTYGGVLNGKLCQKSPAWGTVIIEKCDSLLRTILLRLIADLEKSIKNGGTKEDISDYLAGIFAGESVIQLDLSQKGHGARSVRVSAPAFDERIHYIQCLEKIGIKTHEIKNGFQITGLENLLKVHVLGLMSLDPRREAEFLRMLLSYDRKWRHSTHVWEEYCKMKAYIAERAIALERYLEQLTVKFSNLKLAKTVVDYAPIQPGKTLTTQDPVAKIRWKNRLFSKRHWNI